MHQLDVTNQVPFWPSFSLGPQCIPGLWLPLLFPALCVQSQPSSRLYPHLQIQLFATSPSSFSAPFLHCVQSSDPGHVPRDSHVSLPQGCAVLLDQQNTRSSTSNGLSQQADLQGLVRMQRAGKWGPAVQTWRKSECLASQSKDLSKVGSHSVGANHTMPCCCTSVFASVSSCGLAPRLSSLLIPCVLPLHWLVRMLPTCLLSPPLHLQRQFLNAHFHPLETVLRRLCPPLNVHAVKWGEGRTVWGDAAWYGAPGAGESCHKGGCGVGLMGWV